MQDLSQKRKKWYQGRPAAVSFASRVQEIQKYRTPATKADEFLRIVRFLVLPLLALWCIVISFASLQIFLAHSFGETYATIGAAILCIVIEIGKMKFGSYTFSKLFLEGIEGIETDFAEAAMWLFITGFAAFTFWMSINNSTHGAHNLALLRGNEAHYSAFVPDTKDLDDQIAAANGRVAQNGGIKWKGTVTYQAQQAIKTDSRVIQQLSAQKEQRVKDQRADYELRRAQIQDTTDKGASLVMAAGGYVEILQIISLMLMAACMRVVGDHMDREQGQQHTDEHKAAGQQPITSAKHQPINGAAMNNQTGPAAYPGENDGRVIMFNRVAGGNVLSARLNTVPQFSQTVPQQNGLHGCSAVLTQCREAVQRDLPNFDRKDTRAATVSERINAALDRCLESMRVPGFEPEREVAIKFYQFLTDKAFPDLNARGWGYDRQDYFLRIVSGFVPEQV